MTTIVRMTLSYRGNDADHNAIDLYDAGQALIGFQRSLALTTHLILNNEIITQATSLKGARILAVPPQPGSWKTTALVILSAIYAAGSVPKDTPIGNLVSSAYDYVIHETLGFHVDYSTTLGQQYEEYKKAHEAIHQLPRSRFDSLTEKCESAVRDMHRPIMFSKTANIGALTSQTQSGTRRIGVELTPETGEYIFFTLESDSIFDYEGEVTGYNINTYKGRIYVPSEQRILSFVLGEQCRSAAVVETIIRSLSFASTNIEGSISPSGLIAFRAFAYRSRSGRLKGFRIVSVSPLSS